MTADLSIPRLGTRVLDLLDDMFNWGNPRYARGEVEVFAIEPDHKLYAHMNVKYLRLDVVSKFQDAWQSVLDVLRAGDLFVTTGEVLIPRFAVNAAQSGDNVDAPGGDADIEPQLEWTFPLSYTEGDGRSVQHQRIDLSQTKAFGSETLHLKTDVTDQRWLRVEVWDVATNGAYTRPVWLE